MNADIYLEKNATKRTALEVLQGLGYEYLSPEDCRKQRGSGYHVLLRDVLRGQLRKLNRYKYGGVENEFSASNIERAMDELDAPIVTGLVRASEQVYDMLMLGSSYPEHVGEGHVQNFNLKFIDWECPQNNLFHVTEEFAVESVDKQHNAQPDLVLFINGIPFAVIECKAPVNKVEEAVAQHLRNQGREWIPHLYKYAQMVVATNRNDVRYATTDTPRKFWGKWKEEDERYLTALPGELVSGRKPTEQDRVFCSLFSPERAMELIRYFVVYDAKVKKIARYQQFFAIQRIVQTVQKRRDDGRRQGGVIWHTQGSGKSLTMAMLARYLLMNRNGANPRVVVVTDRKELDRQISNTFAHTRMRPTQAASGGHLSRLLKDNDVDIITTLINKFETPANQKLRCDSEDIYVLVDEGHRTQYEKLAAKMRDVLSRACFLAFTGTPLMKSERRNTYDRFGQLLHRYTILDGVNDGAIVPLLYEGRYVEQNVDEQNIDLWFEQTTKRLTPAQRDDLSRKWSTLRRVSSTIARIRRISLDVNLHFCTAVLKTNFKAMLACNYKRDAVRYLECFEKLGDLKCAALISAPDMREAPDGEDESGDAKVVAFWNKMMERYGDAETYEETIKELYRNGEIDIIIVCSKLLTGFDAPVCQVLYIDKELREHNLLQAIARTNRLAEGKDYGLVIDYRCQVKELNEAMEMYSGAGLEKYAFADLRGSLTDIVAEIAKLKDAYTHLLDVFDSKVNMSDPESIEESLADDKKREIFYKALSMYGRALNTVLNSELAYRKLTEVEIERYKNTFAFFCKVRRSVRIRYCDALDDSEYGPLMQNLLDEHMHVGKLQYLTAPIDIQNQEEMDKALDELGSSRAKAEAIRNLLTRSISEKREENPAYYDNFSQRIQETLNLFRDKVISESEYLKRMREVMKDFLGGKSELEYPQIIRANAHAQAFYGVLLGILGECKLTDEQVAEMSLQITEIIETCSKVDWTHNKSVHDEIAQQIDDLFYMYEKERGVELSLDVVDKIIENVKTVALRRFDI